MSPGEEFDLYTRDRAAWIDYAAPRIALVLIATPEEALSAAWARLKRHTQIAVWEHLPVPIQARIRALRDLEGMTDDLLDSLASSSDRTQQVASVVGTDSGHSV